MIDERQSATTLDTYLGTSKLTETNIVCIIIDVLDTFLASDLLTSAVFVFL